MWLSIGLSMGAEPAEDGEDAEPEVVGAEPDEELIIWGVEVAREMLDEELDQMGYVRQRRRRGKTVYVNRQRWKPTVVLHDSGWMELRSPSVRPRLILLPPFIGMTGTVTSRRKIEAQKSRIVEQTAPLMEIWRDALASEAAWDPDYAPPAPAGPGIDGGDIAREVIALTTGADPIALSEHPLLGRLGDNGFPDPDQEMITVRYHAMLYGLSAITPPVLAAMLATPRHDPLPRSLWAIAPDDRPITTDDGVMAAPGAVAWQLSVADLRPGESVLEISRALGWRAAVMEAMGATVSRSGDGPFDLILLESGEAEEDAVLPLLAASGRLLILSPGHITVVQGGARKTVLMVH